jgi:CheY-like chemotaxis protein
VFMDLQMPRLDGFEATRLIFDDQNLQRVARRGIGIECLALRVCGARPGMDDYVSKPYTVERLVQLLREATPSVFRTPGP